MTIDLFLGLLAFVTVATITPGPNNIMVMASGANFGFSRTLPHIFGIMGGFTTMVAVVGLGLGRVFTAVPELEVAMRFVAFAFLIYLAWKIARSAPPKQGDTGALPLTSWQAAAFQWVNPKAWVMALSAHAVYAPGGAVWAALLVAMAFGIVSVPCVSL